MALYNEHKQVLNTKFSNVVTLKKKKAIWDRITAAVNSENVDQRTVIEVKHKWKDLLTRAKKDKSNRKYPKTGGGPKPEECIYTDIIIDIIGENSATLIGIVDESNINDSR